VSKWSWHSGCHRGLRRSVSVTRIKNQILEQKILLALLLSRVLGALCQELEAETNIYFLLFYNIIGTFYGKIYNYSGIYKRGFMRSTRYLSWCQGPFEYKTPIWHWPCQINLFEREVPAGWVVPVQGNKRQNRTLPTLQTAQEKSIYFRLTFDQNVH
jgi:hypothetical protein